MQKDDFYYEGNDEKALEYFNKAIELDKEGSVLYFGKFLCLKQLSHDDEAIQCLSKVDIKSIEKTIEEVLDIQEYFNCGDYEGALFICNIKLILYPDDIEYYNIKSYILFELEKYEEALKNIDKVIELDSNYSQPIF